jgi:hypothetical protein
MDLARELHRRINDFVAGRAPLWDLRHWLAEQTQAIFESDDPELQAINGRSWTMIAEFDLGGLDEDDVRHELARALPTFYAARHVTADLDVREVNLEPVSAGVSEGETRYGDAELMGSTSSSTRRAEAFA